MNLFNFALFSEYFEAIAVFCMVLYLWLSSCIDGHVFISYLGLVQVLWQRHDFKALLNAVILAKCFKAKLWESSRHMSRQLVGIGETLVLLIDYINFFALHPHLNCTFVTRALKDLDYFFIFFFIQ